MRCQQDSESASGVLRILVMAPSSSLNYNIKMSKEILSVVRGPLTTCKISWGVLENKMPTVSLFGPFHFLKWKSRHFVFWNAPTSLFNFSSDSRTQWISCRTRIIRKKSNFFIKIEGFMSCNTLMPRCAQIMGHWPTALGACYFGNTPTLRPGRCKKRHLQKGWVPLCAIQTSTPLTIVHMASSCEPKNWYSITLNILLHVSPTFH
jgi:hypothetical protein